MMTKFTININILKGKRLVHFKSAQDYSKTKVAKKRRDADEREWNRLEAVKNRETVPGCAKDETKFNS
jgi:hypothetical protein